MIRSRVPAAVPVCRDVGPAFLAIRRRDCPASTLALRWAWAFRFLLLLLAVSTAQADAPKPVAAPLAQQMKDWGGALNRLKADLAQPELTDDALDAAQMALVPLRVEVRTGAEGLTPELKALKQERDALGPAPAADAPPEAPNIAERRKAVDERIARIEGAIKEAELLVAQADRMLDEVSALKRSRFTDLLTSRGRSPLSPKVWLRAWPEISQHVTEANAQVTKWWASEERFSQLRSSGWKLPVAVLTAILLAWPLRLQLLRRYGYISVEGEPTYGQRLHAAFFTGVIRSLLPSAAGLAFYLGLRESDLLSDSGIEIAWSAVLALVFISFTRAFCWGAFAPNAPTWRLIPLDDAAALAVSRLVTVLAAVFGLDWVVGAINNRIVASVELITIQQFISGLLIALLLFALLRRSIWRAREGSQLRGVTVIRMVRSFLRLLVGAIPITAVLGYVALSRVLATQIVLSAGLLVGLALLRVLGDEMIEHGFAPGSPLSMRVRRTLDMSREGCEMLAFWLKGSLRLFLCIAGVLILPLLWGAGGQDIVAWLDRAFFGFTVGSVRISLADIVVGLLVFTVLLIATRLMQRTLEREIFPRTRLDAGVRNSIRAAVGYGGFTVAAALGVATLGIDLSNLAIIAGALSVGVGFGLQSIVGNFVSGIILLVERPVKVGDWIVVGDLQGYVKRISVRATEVSTFDRASVFIPNSNLISGPVTNRTYADPQGRIVIPLSVAYGSDIQRVREVMMAIATSNPNVLESPPPVVLFRSFGESALHFELVAYIPDVNRSLAVTSDLCFAIEEGFALAGVLFPFPHRDVNLQLNPEQLERITSALEGNQRRS